MNMFKNLILGILSLIFIGSLKAQVNGAEPNPGAGAYSYEQQYNNETYAGLGIPRLDKTFNINCYVFKDSTRQSFEISNPEVVAAIVLLNKNFSPIGFNFRLCGYHEIDNFQYNHYVWEDHKYEPMVLYREKNVINLYLCKTINSYQVGSPSVVTAGHSGGFASMPSDTMSFIIMNKIGLTTTQELTRLMGHYFGLFRTDETMFGEELVTQRNCRFTGDLMCDTNADNPKIPLQHIYSTKTNDCALFKENNTIKDSNGDYYLIPSDNFMSSYFYPYQSTETADCRCRFSPGQFRKMYLEVTNPNSRRYYQNW